MSITYEAIRTELARGTARWKLNRRAKGRVLDHALGRRIDETTDREDLQIRLRPEPSLESIVRSARTFRSFKQAEEGTSNAPRSARPGHVDWRNHQGLNAVSPVQDQGNCGSCVAFSTIALLESMLLIERGLLADLSEAEFFFCSQWASCNSGWWEGFAIGRALHEGAVVESVLPYDPSAPSCPQVSNRAGTALKATRDVAFLNAESRKGYLNEVGPMIACMSVYEDFDAFFNMGGGGIYSHVTGAYRGGHCILVIGYDDANGCWICKNSWGTSGGEAGFFRIAYGQCDMDSWAFRGVTGIDIGDRWRLRTWTDKFAGTNATDLLLYNPIMHTWSLGTVRNGSLSFLDSGDTTGFGDLADGRPFWTGDFQGTFSRQLLFYYPGDANWWLGTLQGSKLQWNLVGNTSGFGQVWDGRPFWTGYFSALDRKQLLFHFSGDSNWWLGTMTNTQLQWTLVGNTAGFGKLTDGRPFWIGDFDADGLDEVLFYYPGDQNWWLGSIVAGRLVWKHIGNTAGFGNLADGRPFWTGYLRGVFRTDILFYYPGDRNWWLGTLQGNQLQWSLVGNTSGFGQVWDGRPFWVDDFNGSGGFDILFYYPGDQNWWLGTLQGNQLQWNLVGNTSGFGQIWDSRPIYKGRFSGANTAEILFHYPPDGTWWLGTIKDRKLEWTWLADTTGRFNFK